MRAKEREKKGKQRRNKTEIMKKATKSTSKISPQAFANTLSRAKNLPKSPKRNILVLAKMVESLNPRKRKAVEDLCDINLKRRKEQEKETNKMMR